MDKFIQALHNKDLQQIKQVPKGDLHNHAALGMRFSSFEKWTGETLKKPPLRFQGLPGMIEFIQEEIKPFVRSRDDFEDLLHLAIQDAIEDGVRLAEMSIDIILVERLLDFYPKKHIGFIEFISGLIDQYQDRIEFRPDIGIAKTYPLEKAGDLIIPCIESSMFKSIDLYGIEDTQTLGHFADLYRKAASKNMIRKAHIGEFSPGETIKQTIEELELDEVQHGIRAIDLVEVIEFIKSNNVQLNVCPASNVALGAVGDLKSHPIRILFDNDIRVTINTDDLVLFNKSVSEQYLGLYENGIFTAEELDKIRKNSLDRLR